MKTASRKGLFRTMWRTFSASKLALSIFFLGGSTFAMDVSALDFLTPSPTPSLSSEQAEPKKDLSEFVERLTTRLRGVFGELVQMSQHGVTNPFVSTGSQYSGTMQTPSFAFADLEGHPAQQAVLLLASKGIIDANAKKFAPSNYLRRYEFALMIAKTKLAKEETSLPQVTFSSRGWLNDVPQNASYAPYVAYAREKWLLSGLVVSVENQKSFSPDSSLTYAELCPLLDKNLPCRASTHLVTRGWFAQLLALQFVSPSLFASR